MKILKQLSSILLVFLFCILQSPLKANDPVDIWNIEKKEITVEDSLTENRKEE